MDEEWRPVVGYEGYYEVSSLGNVRSLPRYLVSKNGSRHWHLSGKIIKAWRQKSGHLVVSLHKNLESARYYVHHLVLEAFVGPRPPGQEGCHSPDPNPSNNRADNLRWGSHAENQVDMINHGNSRAKITAETALRVWQLSKSRSPKEIKSLLGISSNTIGGIIHGRTWKHITTARLGERIMESHKHMGERV